MRRGQQPACLADKVAGGFSSDGGVAMPPWLCSARCARLGHIPPPLSEGNDGRGQEVLLFCWALLLVALDLLKVALQGSVDGYGGVGGVDEWMGAVGWRIGGRGWHQAAAGIRAGHTALTSRKVSGRSPVLVIAHTPSVSFIGSQLRQGGTARHPGWLRPLLQSPPAAPQGSASLSCLTPAGQQRPAARHALNPK